MVRGADDRARRWSPLLTCSAAATLYLAFVGIVDGLTGMLLWPAVILHANLTLLLAGASTGNKERKAYIKG